MRPNLAKALERLRWISEFEMPEEIESNANLYEGRVTPVLVNKYERNVEAREICISRYGCKCAVCEMVLQDRYGKAAQGFIHVHHLKSLAEIGAEYKVDPIVDLRPVCPTCHAVIHLRKPSYTIKEVKSMLAKVAEKLKE
jgi:5-methylcytosine-specific restriction protein A